MSDLTPSIKEKLVALQTQRIELGFTFPLEATSIGLSEVIRIRVRRINTVDRAVVETLRHDVQQSVWYGLKLLRDMQQEYEEEEFDSLMDAVKSNEKFINAADKLLIAASIEPRIVATEREAAGDPDALHIDLIQPEDRLAFFFACSNASSEVNRKFKVFRPQKSIESTGVVVDRTGPTPPAAETRPAEPMAPATFRTVESR